MKMSIDFSDIEDDTIAKYLMILYTYYEDSLRINQRGE